MVFEDWINQTNGGLIVALLLCFLLWSLVRRRDEVESNRPKSRPGFLTLQELGRAVFMAARSGDISTYKTFFISGKEASDILGYQANAYLESRTNQAYMDSLLNIQQKIPEKSFYDGVKEFKNGHFALRVKDHEGRIHHVRAGGFIQTGQFWRLR